jgi:hypothetical protein
LARGQAHSSANFDVTCSYVADQSPSAANAQGVYLLDCAETLRNVWTNGPHLYQNLTSQEWGTLAGGRPKNCLICQKIGAN